MKCSLCFGMGYRIIKVSDGDSFIEKITYCPLCEAGERWKYDGRTLEKNRSPFFIQSAEVYLQGESKNTTK